MTIDKSAPNEWDAAAYDRLADAQEQQGRAVLDRLSLRGDERALDAGCGTGRVTQLLVERLPRGEVIAVDRSPAMAEEARRRLGPAAEVLACDLAELRLDRPVEVVLSTATFHWVPDHANLFSGLRQALVPGGRLEAQCGGEGNIARVEKVVAELSERERWRPYLAGWPGPWNFASPAESQARLEAAGFSEVSCWLEDWPVRPDEPRTYLEKVILGAHLDRLPAELRAGFADEVFDALAEPVVYDYVRLNLSALAS
jgi:trans-aconitate 2-methyltransferase